jgi:hypothetical protein
MAGEEAGGVGVKRGMLAVLFLVLLTSLTSGADWYRYQGTVSWNCRIVTGETVRGSQEAYVLVSYNTTPWSISIEALQGDVWYSGEFDQEGTKLQFRASGLGGTLTLVGRGSFNAKATTLNLQGWAFYLFPPSNWFPGYRSWFTQYRFRGAFVDIITRP